jgi:hypothetical protein
MFKPSIRPQFVERILTSPTGEQYRVIFEVTVIAGQMRARAVRAEKIELVALRLETAQNDIPVNVQNFCLPCATSDYAILFADYDFPIAKVSPFTSLLFFNSQPTRAPSVK